MIETIAMWGGFAGIFVAIVAVIMMYLTRKNILDILEKDVILFDKNFELKEKAISTALAIVDEIENNGSQIALYPEFAKRAKACYNDLICVVSDVRVADEFYNIALDNNLSVDSTRIATFKIMCRKDIGLSIKHNQMIKRTQAVKANGVGSTEISMRTNVATANNPTMPSVSSVASAPVARNSEEDVPVRPRPATRPASRPVGRPATRPNSKPENK